jgi:hypothetical protein
MRDPIEAMRRSSPEQTAERALMTANDFEGFKRSLEQAGRTVPTDTLKHLVGGVHADVISYYDAVAYNKGEPRPATVPNFLQGANPEDILAAATVLNDKKKELTAGSSSEQPLAA